MKYRYGKNISLVFGCGGERDKKKRPLMAKIANENCKKIYITDDNPRNENPRKIRDLLSKSTAKNKTYNIGSRASAINKAIQNATPNETILIAGKGHENQQIYKNKIFNISDKKIVKNIKIKKISKAKRNYLHNNFLLKKVIGKIKPVNFNGISIDSRLIKKDNLFVTIKGKKNDGNKFIFDALKKGAGCVITSSNFGKNNKKIISVKNSFSFLNHFAKLKRNYSSSKIIAITGSAGKTSLKELIKDLLKDFAKTHSSPKSYNNHLGVPISLSNLSLEDKFGVFEVGMSKAGEIRKLTKLIKPEIGIITNVGEAHIENFKNINGIAKAKSEIIENIQSGGTIILNRDDKFFNYFFNKAKKYNLKVSTFGIHKKSNIRIKKISNYGKTLRISVNLKAQTLNFDIKDLNIKNVLASIAVLKALKLKISEFIKHFFKIF